MNEPAARSAAGNDGRQEADSSWFPSMNHAGRPGMTGVTAVHGALVVMSATVHREMTWVEVLVATGGSVMLLPNPKRRSQPAV